MSDLAEQTKQTIHRTAKRWRRRRKMGVILGSIAIGAAGAYLLDPENGKQRRAQLQALLNANSGGVGAMSAPSPFPADTSMTPPSATASKMS